MIRYTPEDVQDHHGVAAVIKDPQGRILVQEHVKYGFWTIPVGKAKEGQSPEDALREELREECGIEILEFHEIAFRDYEYIREGKPVTVRAHLYLIMKYSGEVANNEPHKHSRQEFMSVEQIMALPYLSDLTLLYLEHRGVPRAARLSL